MNLIDTHTHLFLPELRKDLDRVVRDAVQNGVQKMMMPDVDGSTTQYMLDAADQYPEHCFPMIGLHPNSVTENIGFEIERIKELLRYRKFWGIGETGIDLYRNKNLMDQQVEAFRIHISLAREYKLPLIIHCRDSLHVITEQLENERKDLPSGIFHAFTGNIEEARNLISMGFKLGIGGIVTFKNSRLPETLKAIDPTHLVLETDSPYLAPVPVRGERNESRYLIHIAEKLAEIYDMPLEKVAEITTKTAGELFGFLN